VDPGRTRAAHPIGAIGTHPSMPDTTHPLDAGH
jgi:hypothetical protein